MARWVTICKANFCPLASRKRQALFLEHLVSA